MEFLSTFALELILNYANLANDRTKYEQIKFYNYGKEIQMSRMRIHT